MGLDSEILKLENIKTEAQIKEALEAFIKKVYPKKAKPDAAFEYLLGLGLVAPRMRPIFRSAFYTFPISFWDV